MLANASATRRSVTARLVGKPLGQTRLQPTQSYKFSEWRQVFGSTLCMLSHFIIIHGSMAKPLHPKAIPEIFASRAPASTWAKKILQQKHGFFRIENVEGPKDPRHANHWLVWCSRVYPFGNQSGKKHQPGFASPDRNSSLQKLATSCGA